MAKKSATAVESQLPANPGKALPCKWYQDEELALLDFLIENQAEAGDGMLFRANTLAAAAASIAGLWKKGGVKTKDAVRTKYASVSIIFKLAPEKYSFCCFSCGKNSPDILTSKTLLGFHGMRSEAQI